MYAPDLPAWAMLRAMPPGAYIKIDPKQLVATVARVRARLEAEAEGCKERVALLLEALGGRERRALDE